MRTITALSIDSLVFDNTNYILEEVKGLECPVIRLPRFNLPGANGAFVSNTLYGERSIRIKGVVNAPDGSRITYLNNRYALINALSFKRDINNNIVPQTMTITLETGNTYTTDVYQDTPLQLGFSQEYVDYEEFQLGFIAADPFLHTNIPVTGTVNLPVGGGTAIPTPIPISLSPSSGGSIILDNTGGQISYPTITLTGPLTNPYIVNLTTGNFMSLNYTINIGDADIIIDCQAQTIFQGLSNITGVQTIDSTFWTFIEGNNTIGFSAAGGSGTCTLTFYPTFLGV